MITEAGTEVRFIAAHAKEHGGGFFWDKEFETIKEAQKCIDDTLEAGESPGHKEYWKNIGEHMKIYKVTRIIEETA